MNGSSNGRETRYVEPRAMVAQPANNKGRPNCKHHEPYPSLSRRCGDDATAFESELPRSGASAAKYAGSQRDGSVTDHSSCSRRDD